MPRVVMKVSRTVIQHQEYQGGHVEHFEGSGTSGWHSDSGIMIEKASRYPTFQQEVCMKSVCREFIAIAQGLYIAFKRMEVCLELEST